MAELPEGVTAGQSGHLAAHDTIHALLERVDDQTGSGPFPFVVPGDAQGLLGDRPDPTTSGGFYYFATDDTTGGADGTLYRSDGTAWILSGLGQQGGELLFATFAGNSDKWLEALHLYVSNDGIDFRDLKPNPVWTPGFGGTFVRNPGIHKVGGQWFLVFSPISLAAPTGTTFVVYSSSDLVNWTHVTDVSASSVQSSVGAGPPAYTPSCWMNNGPFIDRDGTPYFYMDINDKAVAWSKPTDLSGWSTWSTPTQVTFTSMPSAQVTDTTVFRIGDVYHCFVKDEVNEVICHATGTSPTGPFDIDQAGNWAGWGTGVEGQWMVEVCPGVWRLYMDRYNTGTGVWYSETSDPDLLTGWSAPVQTKLRGAANAGKLRAGTLVRLSSTDLLGAVSALDSGSRPAPASQGALGIVVVTDGDYVLNHNAGFIRVDPGAKLDVTLPNVKPGQLIELGINGEIANEATRLRLDVATIVSGSVVMYASAGLITPATSGIPGWGGQLSQTTGIAGLWIVIINKVEIASDGSITYRLHHRTDDATNKTLRASLTTPIEFWAKNIG